MTNQPLSYQRENCSCWITSILNGLLYMLGKCDEIENYIARILYAASTNSGTENEQADSIIAFLNAYEMPISLEVYKKKDVNQRNIEKFLKEKNIVVVDTMNGEHSILLLGKEQDFVQIFEPWWANIIMNPKEKEGKYVRIPEGNMYNAKVKINELCARTYKKRTETPFTMGEIKSRYAVRMIKKE